MSENFGKYELLEKIGMGGMAEVYLAKSFGAEGLEKILVIKKILPELSSNPRFIEMFIAEAKIAVGLNHPNIVQIYDFGKVEGDYYLAMEYVDGCDLGQFLSACGKGALPLSVGDAIYMGIEIVKGLDYAHRRLDGYGQPLQIVHRDISPQNILVSMEGSVKIVDFGIAKATSVAEETPNVVKGKYSYMSPEQASGKAVDQRSDLFSFGVVLFELLCARPLFRPTTREETLSLVKSAVVPDIASLNALIPPQLEHLLYKVLSRNPNDRYGTARDLQVELTRVLYGLGEIHDSVTLANQVLKVSPYFGDVENPGSSLKTAGTTVSTSVTHIQRTAPGTTAEIETRPALGLTPVTPVSAETLGPSIPELMARQRKEVVIIAGEMQGLFDLRARVGQDRWLQVIGEYTRIVDAIAFKNEGVIHRINESGFMMLLGLPVSSENDAERAARMAMDLQEAVAGMSLSLENSIGISLGVSIGEVLLEQAVRSARRRYNWSFYGSSYELAERLSQSALSREILIGGQVYRRIRREFHCEEIDEVRVSETDGASYSVQAYRLEKPKSPREQIIELRKSYHSFYGREISRKILREAYREVVIGESAAGIVIVGPPGVGKSTLVEEFLSGLDPRNVRVVRGVSTPFARDIALGSAGALFAEMMRLGNRTDLRTLRDTLETRLRALFPDDSDEELDMLIGSIGSLFHLKGSTEHFESLDGEERRQRIYLSLTKVVNRFAAKKPLVLAIEDAHHIDPMTLEFSAEYFNGRRSAPVFFICTATDKGVHTQNKHWQALVNARHISLEKLPELGEQEAEKFVRDLLRFHLVDDERLVANILRRSGGNPLYIKEVIDVLSDRGMLKAGAEILPSVTADDDPNWLPASVEGLIGARLDMLDLELKHVLQKVALLWSGFCVEDAGLVLEEDEFEKLDALVNLQLLVRADRPAHGGEESFEPETVPRDRRHYRFCNALTQEVASRTLVPEEAAGLHQGIADFLLARGAETGHFDSALIARHFDGARRGDLAIRYYVEAAEDAFERFGAGECVRLCQKVLQRPELDDEARLDVLMLKQTALHELGHQEASREVLDELHERVMAGPAKARQVEVLLRMASHHFNETDFKEARRFGREALEIAREVGDQCGCARARQVEATIALTEGNRELALERLDTCIEIYRGEQGRQASAGLAACHNLQGVVFRQSGRHRDALDAYELALGHAEKAQDKKLLRQLLVNSALAFVYIGEFSEALRRFELALEQCRRLGHRRDEAILLVNMGHARLLLGQVKEALSKIQRGIHLARRTGSTATMADGQISLGICYLEMGNLTAAERSLHEGLRLADSIPHAYLAVHATLALAQVKLATGNPEDARIARMQAQDAIERSESAKMTWGVTVAHSIMARAQKALGKRDEAIARSRMAVGLLDQGDVHALEEVLFYHAQILPDEPAYAEDRALAIARAREVIMHRRDLIPDEADRAIYMNRPLNRQILQMAQLLKDSFVT